LGRATKNNCHLGHPSLEEFACYVDRNDYPRDLQDLLNRKYPYQPGILDPGDPYWNP